MAEKLTFSAIVDEAIVRSGRIDKLADIASYAHATIREIQSLGFFSRDLIEDSILATASPHIFTMPALFRKMRTIYYPGVDMYPKFLPPGKIQKSDLQKTYIYYRSSDYFVFKGVSAGDAINLAYYTFTRRFAYYTTAARPATYDPTTELWTYLPGYDTTDELKETARNLVTNWIVFNYYDTVIEGTLAKLFKQLGDERRSISSFALYKALQNDVKTNELGDAIDVANQSA